MLDRDQLETFATVLKLQSFERAASHLHLSKGAISQRVSALEESLSRTLIVRERPIRATSHGERLLRYVQALRIMEAEAIAAMASGTQPGKAIQIVLGSHADSMSTWFSGILFDMAKRMAVSLQLVIEEPAAMLSMLQRGELFGCVSSSPTVPRGFSSDALGVLRYRCVAEPRFVDRAFASGFVLPSVLQAHALMIGNHHSYHAMFLEQFFGFAVTSYPQHSLPTPEARLDAIRCGIGYGFLPEMQVREQLQNGQLIDLLPESNFDIDLYWHQMVVDSSSSQQIRLHVNERAKEHLHRRIPGLLLSA